MTTRTLNVNTTVAIDWQLLEAIEAEAESLGAGVDRIVNESVASWVGENVPDYFDVANHELREAETAAVIEDRAPEYPEWFQGAVAEERLEQLRALGERWKGDAG